MMKQCKAIFFGIGVAIGTTSCNFTFKAQTDPFYSAILRENPTQPFVLFAQGERLMEQNQFKEAAAYFRRLNAIEPQHSLGLERLGKCELELGNYAAAERSYNQAIALSPTTEAKLGLAFAYVMQGKTAQAQQIVSTLSQSEAESAVILRLKGDLAVAQGQNERAAEYYGQSLARDPNQETVQLRLKDLLRQ
jgi:tetratricopeptide (TPR) repeat protein